MFRSRYKNISLLLLILIIGVFFRFFNLNWDAGQHLHPDERFLTMVSNSMTWPLSFKEYNDPTISRLNPFNLGHTFFVYGTFPLIISKGISLLINADNYNDFTLLGRFLSALIDSTLILGIYFFGRKLVKIYKLPQTFPLLAAAFYSLFVLPIQLSHFFATDTFLNTFMFLAFVFAFYYYQKPITYYLLFSSIFFGLSLATKLNSVLILPLLVFLLFPKLKPRNFLLALSFLFISYLTLRLADPYKFATSSWFNPSIHPQFISSLKNLNSYNDTETYFPPAIQWIGKPPVTYALKNLALYGIGLPQFIFLIIGFTLAIYLSVKRRLWTIIFTCFWVLGIFIYQSASFVKALRYFIYLYPYFALFSGLSLSLILKKIPSKFTIHYSLFTILLFLVWPLMFLNIYLNPHTRVEASQWIYDQLPQAPVLNELWDDPLPLLLPNNHGKSFNGEMAPVFDPDTPEKWLRLNELYSLAQYYFLTSNRAWGSIMTHPEKYPLMSKYYEQLFSNQTEFKLIKTFSRYPSLSWLGIPLTLNDDWADETFTVYDHPVVHLFEKK